MSCQTCGSARLLSFYAKHDDRFVCRINKKEYDGYAPTIRGFCGGDDTQGVLCLDCGQIQGEFPVDPIDLELESPKWAKYVCDSYASTDVDAISDTVELVFQALDESEVLNFDSPCIQQAFEDGDINLEHMIAALRTTYSIRNREIQVVGWYEACKRCRHLCRKSGQDVSAIMHGLP